MGVEKMKGGRCNKAMILRISFVTLVLIAGAFAFSFTQGRVTVASAAGSQTVRTLNRLGTVSIHATSIGSGAVADPEIDNRPELGDEPGIKSGQSAAAALLHPFSVPQSNRPAHRANYAIPSKEAARRGMAANTAERQSSSAFPPPEPNVPASFVVGFQAPGFAGFNGLSHVDQRTANNGNQFSLEPPDQGLCAGNGFVIETVNDVIQVYNTRGLPLTGVEDMNSFYGLPPAIDRVHIIFGPFLSDPKCYYDHQTQRWFVSELMQDNGTNAGATGRNFNLLAVSQTADPTLGFTVFAYDVTDDGFDGTPNHAGCPCFGDQPLLGADKFGVYQTTNEFGAATFNGAQIYAISKAEIVAAANTPEPVTLVQIDASQQLLPFGGLSYSIQPATAPRGDDWDHDQDGAVKNGAEYFLSALQFIDTFDNRIAVWALTNTKSLNSNAPILTLSFDVISSETYGQPNPANQKAGEIPLGTIFGEPEGQLNTNDDRMNQVVFADGILYGGVNSLLKVGGAEHQGLAWFGVKPRFEGPTLKGKVVRQGYVAVKGNDVLFPSLGINSDGNGVIAFTLAGNGYFPSAAYTDIIDGYGLPFVHVAGAGQDPDDGFTIYKAEGGNGVGRWGDYSAAVADGDRIWMAAEYIPKACSVNALPCRTSLANWGTFFSTVRPFGD